MFSPLSKATLLVGLELATFCSLAQYTITAYINIMIKLYECICGHTAHMFADYSSIHCWPFISDTAGKLFVLELHLEDSRLRYFTITKPPTS